MVKNEVSRDHITISDTFSSHHLNSKMKAILITETRRMKVVDIPDLMINKSVSDISLSSSLEAIKMIKLFGKEEPIKASCSRLAIGPLKGREIKAWYDPKSKKKNKRASKLVGFDVSGKVLIVGDGDLNGDHFSEVEGMLCY